MPNYAIDVPAYVTLRLEAHDAEHAMQLIKADCVIDLGANAFILTEKTELSPGITLFPDGFGDVPSVVIYDDEGGSIVATPTTWTFWINQSNGCGTTYVTSATAATLEEARTCALEACSADWGDGYPVDSLRVTGVAAGNVKLIEWED